MLNFLFKGLATALILTIYSLFGEMLGLGFLFNFFAPPFGPWVGFFTLLLLGDILGRIGGHPGEMSPVGGTLQISIISVILVVYDLGFEARWTGMFGQNILWASSFFGFLMAVLFGKFISFCIFHQLESDAGG